MAPGSPDGGGSRWLLRTAGRIMRHRTTLVRSNLTASPVRQLQIIPKPNRKTSLIRRAPSFQLSLLPPMRGRRWPTGRLGGLRQTAKSGSSRNEVRGRARATNELYLLDAVIEPERLAQISLGQENPRMRMNVAPGSLPDDIRDF